VHLVGIIYQIITMQRPINIKNDRYISESILAINKLAVQLLASDNHSVRLFPNMKLHYLHLFFIRLLVSIIHEHKDSLMNPQDITFT
jgi:hypothetical protein